MLGEPDIVGVVSDASEMHLAGAEFDKEEHVEGLQADSLQGEKVAGQDLIFVMAHEVTPTDGTVANACREYPVAVEHIANGCLGCLVTQLQEFAFDLAISPAWVLLCKAENQIFKLLVYVRSSTLAMVKIGPFPANQLPMPAHYSFRLENAEDIAQLTCSFMADLF